MIKAKYATPVLAFFHWYVPFLLRRDFHEVHIHGAEKKFNRALLVLANHFSWWDAFFIFYLNDQKFNKRYHAMMLEEQLKKYRVFNYGGVYSVKKKSRALLESLDYTIDLLRDPQNLVLLFPQGKIESQMISELHFEKGIDYVLRHAEPGFDIAFTVALTDYFSNRKPTLHLFYEVVENRADNNAQDMERDYNLFYARCKSWVIGQHHE